MRLSEFGDRAVRVDLTDSDDRSALTRRLQQEFPESVVRAGLAAVLIEWQEPGADLRAAVIAVLSDTAVDPSSDRTALDREITIPVDYCGEDLAEVAGMLGLPTRDLIRAHTAQAWRVTMMGFAPGFGYLVPDGASLIDWAVIPRRSTPRRQVPAGSVAVAAGMSATYPTAMPGGWQLLGRTAMTLFDPEVVGDPTLLHPGDRVRFAEAGQ